ncbi:serine palmitoyltransferase [Lactarius akahatsu]|uniref:Serine palmitoyltransferase n=1 Tax=Lactarius akahatsu TaxID=416441 RepID=A0AAD4LAZ3_9AGAM|nr:serine palmitoyltransferase [Lactarius akahatsu]
MSWKREEAAAVEVVWDMGVVYVEESRMTVYGVSVSKKQIPGSHVVARYVKFSHQDDPGRTVLEILLALLVIRFAPFFSPVPAQITAKSTLFSFLRSLTSVPVVSGANGLRPKLANTGKQVLNLASYNFTSLVGNEVIKLCPSWVLGTIDVHMDLEHDIADLLSTKASILYWQGFSIIPCHGDIIVAGRGIGFATQKGLQVCVLHVLLGVEKKHRKRHGPLTRRLIVTEGIFEKNGAMVDLPKLNCVAFPYCHANRHNRQIGRQRAQLIGFTVVDHQRINGTSFIFSAAVPALLAFSASEGIDILRNMPSILSTLQENVQATRAVLDCVEATTPPNPTTPAPRDAPSFDIAGEERLLQDIVDEALAQGVWTTRARQLRGQELVEARPSIRLAVTTALSRKECERAAGVIKAVVVKCSRSPNEFLHVGNWNVNAYKLRLNHGTMS